MVHPVEMATHGRRRRDPVDSVPASKHTFNVKNDDLALDRVGVDCAAVFALVQRMNISHLQVPFLDVRSHDAESRVVHDAPFLVRQRNGVVIQPRYLLNSTLVSSENIL